MKLASLKSGRDGNLVVVSRDLTQAVEVPDIAATLQEVMDDWTSVAPQLETVSISLEQGAVDEAFPFDPSECAAPLPRAYQWADASSYVTHVELIRKARSVELPESYWTEPLMYQGGSDGFIGSRDDIVVLDEAWGIDFEGEIAIITGDVFMGADEGAAGAAIRLIMLANDVSLRNLVPAELAKGFGFYQSKPATGFSPVAVTPNELEPAWREGRVHLPLVCHLNDVPFGAPEAGDDMVFGFPRLIQHAARTRNLCAGTIIGSGTVANADRSRGSCCIAERRMIETLDEGEPKTSFLKNGDRVRIEMLNRHGRSIFGAINQTVVVTKGEGR
jgi:fumarylacetoacetate (FAA) hydrolase